MCDSKRHNTSFGNAIAKYGKDGFEWNVLLKCLSAEEMNDMERYFISNYKSTNDIYNLTDGGDGGNGVKGRKLSEDHKRKIRESNLGKKRSIETRERVRLAVLGTKQSEDTIRKRVETFMLSGCMKKSDETKEKIRQAHIGKVLSMETRMKISESKTGIPWTEARRKAQDNKTERRGAI